jgi:calmodulin
MAPAPSEDQVSQYKEAFTLFDKDGDGCITTKELGTVMRALGKSPTESEIKSFVAEIDPQSKGTVDFTDFLTVMSKDIRHFDSEADLRAAWKVFDPRGEGFILLTELKHVLTNIGEKLSKEEVEDMSKEADPRGEGKVQFEEFIKMMSSR